MTTTRIVLSCAVFLACSSAGPTHSDEDAGHCVLLAGDFFPVPTAGGDGATTAPEAIEGVPFTTFAHLSLTGCPPLEHLSASVASQPAARAATATLEGNLASPIARVDLTAAVPGPHHVAVGIDGAPGTADGYFLVAANRLDAGVLAEQLPWITAECRHLPRRTTSGLVLCERAGEVLLTRDGRDAGSFPGSSLAVIGDVIWSHASDAALERRRFFDGGLVLEARLALPGLVDSDDYSDEALAIRRGDAVYRVTWTDTGLVGTATDGGVPDGGAVWLVPSGESIARLEAADCSAGPACGAVGFAAGSGLVARVAATPARHSHGDFRVEWAGQDSGVLLSNGWAPNALLGPIEGEALPVIIRLPEAYAAFIYQLTSLGPAPGGALQSIAWPETIGGYPYNPATPPRPARITRDWIVVAGPGTNEVRWIRR